MTCRAASRQLQVQYAAWDLNGSGIDPAFHSAFACKDGRLTAVTTCWQQVRVSVRLAVEVKDPDTRQSG